ncbi:MAG: Tex family protein [Spirochaetales bacterium]|uniref:Tex family protein n=1 Tax=Candidatus Thalassospirochaeta sargassi TaxID=3119039 RepID=A0AAJ1MKW5_9SPIO|nr:Tex family protein [Spirochaetales bacterium]
MNNAYIKETAAELGLRDRQVQAVADLLAEGATVPFISRYRKEMTGNLDEVQIIAIRDRMDEIEALEKRRESILSSLIERELLTPELENAVRSASSMNVLEDVYLPYRPKRKTRASAAKEKGLQPLADAILSFNCADPEAEAAVYIDSEKGVDSVEAALAGASDIIAEKVSENAEIRGELRTLFERRALLSSTVIKKKASEAEKYKDYFDYSEPLSRVPSHRFLAVMRGADEGFLKWHISPDKEDAVHLIDGIVFNGACSPEGAGSSKNCSQANGEFIEAAVDDAWERLISPSLETEFRNAAKKEADLTAIDVFAGNVRNLLLEPPLGRRRMLAVDPGLRTGCKIVVLSAEGDLLEDGVIYPLPPHNKEAAAAELLKRLAVKYDVEAIAVGNGTGGREAEAFVRQVFPTDMIIEQVNESGASIYSASETARKEFPDKDVTVRGAVSIGRRLMDPLAELVKIEPKSIGVGQYQHDVDQKLLKKSLDDVVVSCVNSVGVELNTASRELLSYVSGLSSSIAGKLLKQREKKPFTDINQLHDVAGVGDKVFQQAAGFLRITDGDNPLDAGAVHPESYGIVEKMALRAGVAVSELAGNAELAGGLMPEDFVTESAGLPTITDIIEELKKPGRDPRPEFQSFSFDEGVSKMSDLTENMILNGVVTNVTAFGAFVDIGVHQDGLVHISQIADHFVRDPADELKVNQKVRVKVLTVDEQRKRISLSMKGV